jgi:hypothetical protein
MQQNRTITLAQAREAFPSLGESAACAQKLKAAIFEGVKESDMKAIMEGLVKKAKHGDLAATKTLLDFVSKSAPAPQLSLGARLNVAGRPVNGHAQAIAEDDLDPPDTAAEDLRLIVTTILHGDRLGKTPEGIRMLINQREGQAEIDALTLEPILDGMVLHGELEQSEGRYKLGRKRVLGAK